MKSTKIRMMTMLISALSMFVTFFVSASACAYRYNQPKVPETMLED